MSLGLLDDFENKDDAEFEQAQQQLPPPPPPQSQLDNFGVVLNPPTFITIYDVKELLLSIYDNSTIDLLKFSLCSHRDWKYNILIQAPPDMVDSMMSKLPGLLICHHHFNTKPLTDVDDWLNIDLLEPNATAESFATDTLVKSCKLNCPNDPQSIEELTKAINNATNAHEIMPAFLAIMSAFQLTANQV